MRDAALRLRPAGVGDLYSLWLWANDPDTRAASFRRTSIPWREHQAWLAAQFANGHVLIGETTDGQPVGSIRFDSADSWTTARLSYVVAPESRGSGWSRPLVRLGVAWLAARHPSVVVIARVSAENARSLGVFRGEAWPESLDAGQHVFRREPEPSAR